MMPHVHHGDTKYGIWWRRWVGTIALLAVVIVGTAGFFKVEAEGTLREEQFCGLVINSYQEKADRIDQTKTFLATPDSEFPQSLIDLKSYIRAISLPLTLKEFRNEKKNIPRVCWQYFEGMNRKGDT